MKQEGTAGLGQRSSVLRTVGVCEYRPEEMTSTPLLRVKGALLGTVTN